MANRFLNPNVQFSNSAGVPFAGGTLSFYASGTSTPLATYSNQALTIANTNPVVLDSAGQAEVLRVDPAELLRAPPRRGRRNRT
jgi:hypothetical protein